MSRSDKSALLVMDVQRGIVGQFGDDHAYVQRLATAISAARAAQIPVSTLRQAADLDYQLVVLSDGCLDAGPEVHRVLTEKIFPRQADVRLIADWKPE